MNNIEEIATSFAREYGNDAIYPSHLFKAILHKDIGMVHFIETDLDKDYYYLQEWADVQMQLSPKTARPVRDPHYSQEAEAVMEEAENYQMKLGLATCEPVCILASLATPGVGFSLDQLKTLPLTVSEIMAKVEGTAHRDGKEKGDELGYFLFGGSDFVLVFQKDADFRLISPKDGDNAWQHILMGEKLGEVKSVK